MIKVKPGMGDEYLKSLNKTLKLSLDHRYQAHARNHAEIAKSQLDQIQGI
jgi:hypothetical protein